MCSQMMALARAGKCGSFGACGSASSEAQAACSGRPASAAPAPNPRKSRREEWLMVEVLVECGGSEAVEEVVRIGEGVYEVDEGRGARGLAHVERLPPGARAGVVGRVLGIGIERLGRLLLLLVDELHERRLLEAVRRAPVGRLVEAVDLRRDGGVDAETLRCIDR